MDRIHRQAEKHIDDIRHVAVVVGEVGNEVDDQRHAGIVYRVDDSGQLQFLHLAWNRDLRLQDRIPNRYCWVDPQIPKARLRQLAAICEDIAHANLVEQIPYSFGSPTEAFDERTKKFLLGPTTTGLTCASFVLAVFERAQLRLARYIGWASPDLDDIRWQQSVLDALRMTPGVSQEHINAVEREVGNSVRYRPEQVAGAAAIRKRRPVKYRYAKSLGSEIVRFLQENRLWRNFECRVGIVCLIGLVWFKQIAGPVILPSPFSLIAATLKRLQEFCVSSFHFQRRYSFPVFCVFRGSPSAPFRCPRKSVFIGVHPWFPSNL